MMQMLECLKLSQRLLTLCSSFWILSSCCCTDGMSFPYLCSKSSIRFLVSSTLLLIPYKLFLISVSISFISAWVFFMLLKYQVPWASLQPVFWTLHLIDCLSLLFRSFTGVFMFFHLGHISLSPCFAASLCLFLYIRWCCFDSVSW